MRRNDKNPELKDCFHCDELNKDRFVDDWDLCSKCLTKEKRTIPCSLMVKSGEVFRKLFLKSGIEIVCKD